MKFLLLLLALELVSSDKLDRTYLPPPGAKYAGGTLDDINLPLEYPRETYEGSGKNGFVPNNFLSNKAGNNGNEVINNETPAITSDNSASPKANNFRTTIFPMNTNPEYGINSSAKLPVLPSKNYLPSKPTFNQATPKYTTPYFPFYTATNPENRDISTFEQFTPGFTVNDPKYYYFVPANQGYRNDIANPRKDNNGFQNIAMIQYPNQNDKDSFTGRNENLPKDITPNYQQSTFGYYGGNPMIMTSLTQIPRDKINNNNLLISKFGTREDETPKITVEPFQTPLLGIGNNIKHDESAASSITPELQTKSLLPTTTIRSFPKEDARNKNTQRNGILSRPRYKPQKPQGFQPESDSNAVIVKYENSLSPEGYSYSYDTSNGIHADETATTTNGVRAKGSYSYTGNDGKVYTVTYTADENGFRPQGDHLPTPPPIPEAIKKVIQQAEIDKAAGIVDDGSYDEGKYGYLNYESGTYKYLPIKKNNRITSRPNSFKRKPGNSMQRKNKNNLNKESILANRINPEKQVEKSYNDFISHENKNSLSYLDYENNEKKILNTENRSGLESDGIIKEKNYIKNRRPITSVSDGEVFSKDTSNNNQIKYPDFVNNTTIITKDISKTLTANQTVSNENPNSSPGATLTDSGYFYVPPLIKLNPIKGKSSDNTSTNLSSKNEILMRSGFGYGQRANNSEVKENPALSSNNTNTEATTTRKPYISGPETQEHTIDEQDFPVIIENNNGISSYPNNQISSQYLPSTTPIITQPVENQPKTDSQIYQSTNNPILLNDDEKLHSTVENRISVPTSKPGITISQDFSTTIKPDTFKNGVLEVQQNVKIFGLGEPATADEYPENNFGYNNDVFYPTSTPILEPNLFGPSTSYPGFDSATGIVQENSNQNNFNVNPYVSTAEPQISNGGIPESVYSPNDRSSETGSQGYPSQVPDIPFPPNSFGFQGQIPGYDQMNPSVIDNQIQNRIIGEDFSGPQQAQNFDPVNGYYYK